MKLLQDYIKLLEDYTLLDIACDIDFTECKARGERNNCFGLYRTCYVRQKLLHTKWVKNNGLPRPHYVGVSG